jgi:hypothetical protein
MYTHTYISYVGKNSFSTVYLYCTLNLNLHFTFICYINILLLSYLKFTFLVLLYDYAIITQLGNRLNVKVTNKESMFNKIFDMTIH